MNIPMYNPYQFNNQQTVNHNDDTLIPIHSELEVINYPVAPGHSVSFRHENEPFIYIKKMGLSQFDRPEIVKYRLTREQMSEINTQANNSSPDDAKWLKQDDIAPILDDIKEVRAEIENIKKQIDEINSHSGTKTKTTVAKEK